MHFEVLMTPIASPEKNMEMDVKLLESLAKEERSILHFYAWEGRCATYGHFIDPYKFLNEEKVRHHKLHLARRPTGGGLIFHHCDLAFSVLIPAKHPVYSLNTLSNYAFVNGAVIEAIKNLRGNSTDLALLENEKEPLDEYSRYFCMAKPTIYDVMVQDRKVGGGAQRRTKYGLLHQGTIALSLPSDLFLKDILMEEHRIIQDMHRNGYVLLGENITPELLEEGRREMQFLLLKAMQKRLCI